MGAQGFPGRRKPQWEAGRTAEGLRWGSQRLIQGQPAGPSAHLRCSESVLARPAADQILSTCPPGGADSRPTAATQGSRTRILPAPGEVGESTLEETS